MLTRNRIPPALEKYLQLQPEASLIVLTGTLGCSANWLTSLLVGNTLDKPRGGLVDDQQCSVLLVSWMRDQEFWRGDIRRRTGVDVLKYVQEDRFAFLDCFTTLPTTAQDNSLSNALHQIKSTLEKISDDGKRRTILILDAPDVQLAMASTTAHQLNHFIMEARSLVHSTILSVSADLPLVSPSLQSAGNSVLPMEAETALFVTSQAHVARQVISVRDLTSGAAKDVSGVLRITRGGHDWDNGEQQVVEQLEMLYLVQRDGAVKVFERGALP